MTFKTFIFACLMVPVAAECNQAQKERLIAEFALLQYSVADCKTKQMDVMEHAIHQQCQKLIDRYKQASILFISGLREALNKKFEFNSKECKK